MGDCVVAVTTAASTVKAGVLTPENTLASIDPAASVTFKNCLERTDEKVLTPPLTELTAAVSFLFTKEVNAAVLVVFFAVLNVYRILYFTVTPVGTNSSVSNTKEVATSFKRRLLE